MKHLHWGSIFKSYIIAAIAGYLFHLGDLPIPWILGPMTAMIIWKAVRPQEKTVPKAIFNGGLVILGIFFGLSFTAATFITVGPYILPFLLTTIVLLAVSVINSLVAARFINIDSATSVFGSIPGGLSEMVAASESVNANSAMVTIFQTVRLLTVVFTVPFLVVYMFAADSVSPLQAIANTNYNASVFSYGWFIIPILAGWLLRNRLPAAYVIGPLLATALLNSSGVELPMLPKFLLILAQVSVGISMGSKITIQDLKLGGKYCGIYFLLAMIIIATSFGLGYLFSLATNLHLPTALLSFAPGGLVEMVLTAKAVGADPAIVSSLQFIRLLFIIIFVPSILKWFFTIKQRKHLASFSSSNKVG
ncbi:AbrB family transcriptional regulator [Cytobacillus suaedae]|nr:AbrB family transcriptional regulator [Cytobacillus suaedae]